MTIIMVLATVGTILIFVALLMTFIGLIVNSDRITQYSWHFYVVGFGIWILDIIIALSFCTNGICQ